MLDCLHQPVAFETIGPLQSGAMMAIVDCYDRKVERDFFAGLGASALALHTAMGRLHTISVIKQMTKEDAFKEDPEREIDIAIKSLVDHATLRQKELQSMCRLLVQCPNSEDAIN